MLQDVLFLKGHILPPYNAQTDFPAQINDYKGLQTLIQDAVLNNLEHFQWDFNVMTSNTSLKQRVKKDLTNLGFEVKFAAPGIFLRKFSVTIDKVDYQCDAMESASEWRPNFKSVTISEIYFSKLIGCLNPHFSPNPLTEEPPKDLIAFDGVTLPPALSIKLRHNIDNWYGYNVEVFNGYFFAAKKEFKGFLENLETCLMWQMQLFKKADTLLDKKGELEDKDMQIDIQYVKPEMVENLRLYISKEHNCHTFLKENTLFISERES